MYRICVPPELAIPHLLEWGGVQPGFRDLFEQAAEDFNCGDCREALSQIERIRALAEEDFDYHAVALAFLFQAEALRRLQRWEDCLDAVREAVRWLGTRVGAVASYNRAIAAYLEGLVHFTLGSELKTVRTFSAVRNALEESERHWEFERNSARAADCRYLAHWVADLKTCMPAEQSGKIVLVLPVYAIIEEALDRTGVFCLDLVQSEAGGFVGVIEGERRLHVHNPEERGSPLVGAIDPSADYFAIRLPKDHYMRFDGQKGDLLIIRVELLSGQMAGEDPRQHGLDGKPSRPDEASEPAADVVYRDQYFVRRPDGYIQFTSSVQPLSQDAAAVLQRPEGRSVFIIGGNP